MNYSLLSFILIIVPLAIILIVVVKKFPQLAVLDVDNIPEVKAGRKKDEVFKKRVEEKAAKSKKDWLKKIQPLLGKFKEIQNKFRDYVLHLTRRVQEDDRKIRKVREPKEVREKKKLALFTLLREGDSARENEDWQTAENKYITAIRLDPKCAEAYQSLADVYLKQNQTEEARETYEFVLQLAPENDEVLVKLGEIYLEKGDTKKAIDYYQRAVLANDSNAARFVKLAELLGGIEEYETALEAIKQAVELEPNNPKHLDILTEMSIMSGDKLAAEAAYDKLRMTNPDNQKLASFKDRIEKMQQILNLSNK